MLSAVLCGGCGAVRRLFGNQDINEASQLILDGFMILRDPCQKWSGKLYVGHLAKFPHACRCDFTDDQVSNNACRTDSGQPIDS